MYHNTKQALLAAFDLRGVKCKGMKFDYISDYPTVNRYATEPSSFDERLAQDGLLRRALREGLSRVDYHVLQFCYSMNNGLIVEAWRECVYQLVVGAVKHCSKVPEGLLFEWLLRRVSSQFEEKGVRKENTVKESDITAHTGLSKNRHQCDFVDKIDEVLSVWSAEDRASSIIEDAGWFIGEKSFASSRRMRWRRSNIQGAKMEKARRPFYCAIKAIKDGRESDRLLSIGYSSRSLKKHISSLFTREMSWENHGTVWHVDHVIPISYFIKEGEVNLSVIHDMRNVRPMLKIDNIKKKDRIVFSDVSSCAN